MRSLLNLVETFSQNIPSSSIVNPAISEGSVGWHIEHSCLVIIKITETVKASNPANYQWKFNFKRTFVLLAGKFPRGKAKAPASVLPSSIISEESLTNSIQQAKVSIHALMSCQKNQYFLHPVFGDLNKNATLPFLAVHTKHHLKIISDILK